MRSVRSAFMQAAFSRGRSPRTCRSNSRRSSNWSSSADRQDARPRRASLAARSRRRGDRVRRREFITLLGGAAAAWPLAARAQQPSRVPKIGYLSPVSASSGFLAYEMFRQGLRELGYVDGTNIVIEYRFADGQFDRLPALAAELVQLKVDVIVTAVTQASLAARDATKTIPIVIAGVSDPVGSGLIENLARPGGNITGTSSQTSEVVGKSLELLKEVIPGIVRVAALWNPSNVVFQTKMLKEAETAAAALRIQLKVFGGRDADELGGAFTAIAHEHADALLVLADPFLISRQKNIVDFALKQRLPAIYATKEHATVGGLMTYGPNINGQFRRAAAYVDRILKGAKPSDLPVEQPTQFELAINLKTAKVLGLDHSANAARPRRRGDRMRRARVHHAARRRGGGVAARGAGAAGATDAAHRSARHTRRVMTRRHRCATVRLCRGCRSWAGALAGTYASIRAGQPAIPAAFAALL